MNHYIKDPTLWLGGAIPSKPVSHPPSPSLKVTLFFHEYRGGKDQLMCKGSITHQQLGQNIGQHSSSTTRGNMSGGYAGTNHPKVVGIEVMAGLTNSREYYRGK
jgi:hypothetical protein